MKSAHVNLTYAIVEGSAFKVVKVNVDELLPVDDEKRITYELESGRIVSSKSSNLRVIRIPTIHDFNLIKSKYPDAISDQGEDVVDFMGSVHDISLEYHELTRKQLVYRIDKYKNEISKLQEAIEIMERKLGD